jgi:MarR family transcriptional regulator for hemolysin
MMSGLPESPEEGFSKALHGSARLWRLALDKRLKHLGIGQAAWMTIATIAKSDAPMSQRALADLVGVEGPSMVSMLDRLERDGYVTRAPCPNDRRVKLAHLTDAGRTVYAEVRKVAEAFRTELLAGVDPDALAAAARVLETVRARIEGAL